MAGKTTAQGSVPDGWKQVRLGDVATLQRGMDLPEAERVSGGIPVYGSNGVLGFHDSTPIDGPGVITGRSGSIGIVYYSETAFWPLNTTLFVKDFHGNSERYIYHLLANLGLERFAASTGVPSLNRNFVHPHLVAIPPLPEQCGIAAVLDSIDDAIKGAEAVIDATERLREALPHDLLTRGIPGQHTEWRDVSGLGTVPADWDVVRLGDVTEVASGQVDPRGEQYQHEMFVAPDDIESGTSRLVTKRTVADAGAISGKYQFDARDVLYSKIRPYLKKVCIPEKSGLCSADIYPIRPTAKLERNFLATILLSVSFTEYIRTCSDRTGIPKVNRADLFRFQIALPPLSEQRTIAGALVGVDSAIEVALEERNRLRLVKESAAGALLAGQVRMEGRK